MTWNFFRVGETFARTNTRVFTLYIIIAIVIIIIAVFKPT